MTINDAEDYTSYTRGGAGTTSPMGMLANASHLAYWEGWGQRRSRTFSNNQCQGSENEQTSGCLSEQKLVLLLSAFISLPISLVRFMIKLMQVKDL